MPIPTQFYIVDIAFCLYALIISIVNNDFNRCCL